MRESYCVEENKACVRWVEKYFQDCVCNVKDDLSFGFGLISLLPTQYYTALLYTISTVVLVLQSIYYDHIYGWCNRRKTTARQSNEEDQRKPLNSGSAGSGIPIPRPSTRPSSTRSTPRREFYYTSARSLAGSGTPPFRTYLRAARSGPSAMAVESDSSSEDEAIVPRRSTNKSPIQPCPISKSAGYGTFLAASVNLPLKSNALTQIKRGSVEGLNPLMFLFALLANVTYVGSILIRSTEWERIKANMPWLLDAVVCVALDLFLEKATRTTTRKQGKRIRNPDCISPLTEIKMARLAAS
ncbi:hypothetical protein TIFTF001_002528 [Ficus carica]|uniref:Uncharacterized protein n=1 Tax=Ficus carica TaxID=3494 RepID=A0AA87Z6N9_FICCA|nr:hypothetical protein TIFTF001_002528 [Ficus carica]